MNLKLMLITLKSASDEHERYYMYHNLPMIYNLYMNYEYWTEINT